MSELPPDPFEDWPPPGLEEALESVEDEEERQRLRVLVRELSRAKLDVRALVGQEDIFAAMRAIGALTDARARAALFWLWFVVARRRSP